MVQRNMSKQHKETNIKCKICGKEFEQITNTHLRIHNMTMYEYREQFPDTPLISESCRKRHSLSKKVSWKDPEYRKVHSGENHPMFGKHHTLDFKQKLSEANLGKKASEETKQKMSMSHSGEKNGMYGKHHTEETKHKISKACLGKPSHMKGKHHTEETKQLMRDSSPHLLGEKNGMYGKGYLFVGDKNPMYGVEPWNKGETKETNIKVKGSAEKISKTKKAFFATDEGQRYIEEHMSGKNSSFYGRHFIGKENGMYGRHHTEEAKQSISINHPDRSGEKNPMYGKGYLVTGEKNHFYGKHHTEETLKKIIKAVCAAPNKPEQHLQWLLNEIFPNEYKFVGDGSVIIGGYSPDFINTNGQKKLIEMFGDYWHKGDDEGNRIFQFKLFGFDTLVVWEHELRDDEIEMTIAKIMEFHFRDKEKGGEK